MTHSASSHRWLLLTSLLLLLAPSVCFGGHRIGVIMSGDIPYYGVMHEVLVRELFAALPAGEKPEIILQRPFPDPIAWSNAARKLIAVDVDLIITYGGPATMAVVHEKSSIPLVYAGVYEPEHAGIKGNTVTGCGFRVPLSSLLRYLKRMSVVKGLTVLFSSNEEDTLRQRDELLSLAKAQNIPVRQIDIRTKGDLDELRTLAGNDPVFLTGGAILNVLLEDIITTTRAKKMPLGSILSDTKVAGVLIALFQPPEEQGKSAAVMAARILRGEKPATIVPEVLRETELVFNQLEAERIGISIPIQLIVEATRVIK